MTDRDLSTMDDTREIVYARAGYRCEICGAPLTLVAHPQLAHRIPKNTRNLARYGKRVINHPMNLAATCSLKCNGKADIRNHPVLIAALVAQIRTALQEES